MRPHHGGEGVLASSLLVGTVQYVLYLHRGIIEYMHDVIINRNQSDVGMHKYRI